MYNKFATLALNSAKFRRIAAVAVISAATLAAGTGISDAAPAKCGQATWSAEDQGNGRVTFKFRFVSAMGPITGGVMKFGWQNLHNGLSGSHTFDHAVPVLAPDTTWKDSFTDTTGSGEVMGSLTGTMYLGNTDCETPPITGSFKVG